ncbi:MAG: hypothetical protein J5616_04555 [Bacteroidaceae bacterium]|nr:hypothetical protein [Bacteroidaceae bacterium]
MKRTTIIILLMLIATSTFAQPREIKRTDRLLTAPGLPRYSKGKDMSTRFVESFRYGGNEEAKRWWTGYYEPTVGGAKTAEKARKKRERIYGPYEKKWDRKTTLHPRYGHMFLAKPSFSPPYGFSYNNEDTALVSLTQHWDGSKKHKKVTMTTHKMKVDEAIYDSIQCLHKLAVYTSAQFDADYTTLDGTRYHFIWTSFDGDKYAISSDNGSRTCKQLQSTFNKIYEAINTDDHELIQSLMPTIHELLAHYRTLLLPDIPIDDWDLDASARKRKNN